MTSLSSKVDVFKLVLEPPVRLHHVINSASDQTTGELGPYSPGSTVHGSVHIVLREPMKMRGIQVCSEGVAKMSLLLKEQADRTAYRMNEHVDLALHENTKTYFKWSHLLWKPENNVGPSATMPAGCHVFSFQFELPSSIPSSFEGEKGSISYWVQASLITADAWSSSQERKQTFTVVGVFDLNEEMKALASYTKRMEDSLCCWCCAGGNYGIDLHFDRKGFVAGEAIKPVKCEIKNDTSSNCILKIWLKVQTAYITASGQNINGDSKTVFRFQRFIPSETTVNETEILKIPPETPPSKFTGCNFIINHYKLEFLLQPNGCNLDMIQFETEILVGTIPVNFGYSAPVQAVNIPAPSFTHGNVAHFQYPNQMLSGQSSYPVVSQPTVQPLDNSKETHPLLPVSNREYQSSTSDGASCSWMPDRLQPSAPIEVGQGAAVPQQPPPSYEECVAVKILSGADGGVIKFSPVYGANQTSKTGDKEQNFI